jgi:integrase
MPPCRNRFAFTVQRLSNIKPPEQGRDYYRDAQTTGLVFVVTKQNSRTFYFSRRINGKPTRIKIGNYPDTTIDTARRTAHRFLGETAQGHNPYLAIKRQTRTPTLQALFDHWLEVHSKKYKKTWERDAPIFQKYTEQFRLKQIHLITEKEVALWHQKLGEQHGKYQANRVLQLVRSLFIVAKQIGYTGANPFAGVRLFPEPARERFLLPEELARFYESLEQEADLWRDLFLITLLTGQRKNNVCRMQWHDLDLSNNLWFVAGATLKNGCPLAVVISEPAAEILNRRKDDPNRHTTWVFPSPFQNKNAPCCPRGAWDRIRTRADLEDVRIHDLRRTFGSWQAIDGTSLQIIARALGHKAQKSAEIYARLITEPVRVSVERAAQRMLKYCRANDPKLANETE